MRSLSTTIVTMRTDFINIVSALLFIGQAKSELKSIPLPTDMKCPSSHVFDYSGLICSDCDSSKTTGLLPDMSYAGFNGNPISCTCPEGTLENTTDCTIQSLWDGSCKESFCSTECKTKSQVPSLSQKTCIFCAEDLNSSSYTNLSSSEYDVESSECRCSNPSKGSPTGSSVVTRKLVEIYEDKSGLPLRYDCARCPDGTAVITKDLLEDGQYFFSTGGVKFSADPYTCASCPDPHMFFDTDYSCTCYEGFYLTGEPSIGAQSCIQYAPSVISSNHKVHFREPPTSTSQLDFELDSIMFSHLYSKVASECEYYEGASQKRLQSCQALGNLCVLNMYDEEATACKQLQTIYSRRLGSYHGQEEWKTTLPFLYYGDADGINGDRGIKMKISLQERSNHTNVMKFKVAKYSLNGTFLGIEDLANQLEYCRFLKGRDGTQPWLSFGNGFLSKYSCPVSRLLEEEMYFYDMYVVDDSQESCKTESLSFDCLHPVPVLNRNFMEGNSFPNINKEPLDELNNRYTRRFFLFDNMSGRSADGLEAIRYAKSVVLQMSIQPESPNNIFPPILEIDYGIETNTRWAADAEGAELLDLVFQVEYSMKSENFWASLQVLVGFVFALAAVVFGVRMNNWQSRQIAAENESVMGMKLVVHAVIVACHVFAMLFFTFMFLLCLYWFVFFKLQKEVFLMLPPGINDFMVIIFRALFWSQSIVIAHTIVEQCRSDVFFIDWERPKGAKGGVSMWRTVLVANEWKRMQSQRKNSVIFSLLLVAFLMIGLGQSDNAAPHPNFDRDTVDNGHVNVALQFANTCLLFGIAAFSQWLWRFIIYERYITEPPSLKFVDLCTVCNTSVVVMLEQHKGYYLHCRSPYQYADCTMEETLIQLKKEEAGVTIDRGLDGAPGRQIFSLYASPNFRRQMQKIYSFAQPMHNHLRKSSYGWRTENSESENKNERLSVSKSEMNSFLQHFIDKQPLPSKDGLNYVVREPWLVERLFGVTPADFRAQSDPKCILQPEQGKWNQDYSFLSSTFLGIEIDLLIHDILTYQLADMAFNNSAISVFLTFVMDLLRSLIRSRFGKQNLSRSSFIDSRFLFD